jgi:A/G-specific adenine glycosylase
MMDLGATVCTPKRPACALCPLSACCRARAAGIADQLPRKAAKAERPTRYGVAFVAIDPAGRLLVRTRPPKGLLGGMTEVPTTEWSAANGKTPSLQDAPFRANWIKMARPVTHTFTHFPLELTVFVTRLHRSVVAPAGMRWVPLEKMAAEAFPTVFRKVLAAAEFGGAIFTCP